MRCVLLVRVMASALPLSADINAHRSRIGHLHQTVFATNAPDPAARSRYSPKRDMRLTIVAVRVDVDDPSAQTFGQIEALLRLLVYTAATKPRLHRVGMIAKRTVFSADRTSGQDIWVSTKAGIYDLTYLLSIPPPHFPALSYDTLIQIVHRLADQQGTRSAGPGCL